MKNRIDPMDFIVKIPTDDQFDENSQNTRGKLTLLNDTAKSDIYCDNHIKCQICPDISNVTHMPRHIKCYKYAKTYQMLHICPGISNVTYAQRVSLIV